MAQFRTPEEMFPLVEAYLEREQTKTTFCAEHGLSESVLGYWLTKYRHQNAPPSGAFVEITPTLPEARAWAEVIYPHGVRVRLFAPLSPAELERLVRFSPRRA